ncbi:hypothetical protein M2272_005903 [Mycobacterium frederiksbergense]|uniref:Uncharacterized protein n=1 Tax=Mycolicibacterium frederiksbergense TaxID=117567 RepID=A0ABT6LB70_9MYCO|nr:hypothetical protein [Mycolicibacterium frederiksbergense]MDH6199235.1 hypothetical protein [Mycolicibacterium frederiksbergense]
MIDTRIIHALGNTKAGAEAARKRERSAAEAAFDDARTDLWELLNEGPNPPLGVREDLEADLNRYEEVLKLLRLGRFWAAAYISKVIIGDLTLVADRWVA